MVKKRATSIAPSPVRSASGPPTATAKAKSAADQRPRSRPGPVDTTYSVAWKFSNAVTRDAPHTRDLLNTIGRRHRQYATLHSESAAYFLRYHRGLTLAVMIFSATTALAISAADTLASITDDWMRFLSGAVLGLVTVLTAINEFMEFQKLEEKHRLACKEHERAFMIIALAITRDLDGGEDDEYEYGPILDAINQIHDRLRRNGVDIPQAILARHKDAKPPWYVFLNDEKASRK